MKKIKIFLFLIIISICVFLLWMFWSSKEKRFEYFPSSPTQKEREQLKNLPKEKCPCWDDIKKECLPQADCL